jgi:hypothetical protein
LVESGILLGQAGLPSKNKWGTMTTAASQIALGTMLFGALPRAFKLAFPTYDDGAAEADDPENPLDEDFQA